MLFQVSTIHSCNFYWCFYVYYVQIVLLKQVTSLHVTLHVAQVVANKIIIKTFSLVSVKYFIIARSRYGIMINTLHTIYKTHMCHWHTCFKFKLSCTVHSYKIVLNDNIAHNKKALITCIFYCIKFTVLKLKLTTIVLYLCKDA